MRDDADYPRMLYRPGKEVRVWNLHDVDTRVVASPDEHNEAEGDGWQISPAHRPLTMLWEPIGG